MVVVIECLEFDNYEPEVLKVVPVSFYKNALLYVFVWMIISKYMYIGHRSSDDQFIYSYNHIISVPGCDYYHSDSKHCHVVTEGKYWLMPYYFQTLF